VEDPNPVAGSPSLHLRLARVNEDPNRFWYQLKDRLDEPERESEWELIKILLEGDEDSNKMNTASKTHLQLNYPSWPRPRSHWSATGPRNQQPPSQTRERSGTTTRAPLTYNGQAGEQHRSDRFLLAKHENFHKRPLHRSGRCSSPIRLVQARKSQIRQTGLPSSKLTQTHNNSNTGQQRTHTDVHPRQNPLSLCTGQTGDQHRSDRSGLPAWGWTAPAGQLPPNPTPDQPNRSTNLCKTLGIVGTPHGCSIAKIWSTKTC
jgi:hypothetical protein